MKYTDVRKSDIANLSETAKTELIWSLLKVVNETAQTFCAGDPEPRDLCVITPGQIFDEVETAVWG